MGVAGQPAGSWSPAYAQLVRAPLPQAPAAAGPATVVMWVGVTSSRRR